MRAPENLNFRCATYRPTMQFRQTGRQGITELTLSLPEAPVDDWSVLQEMIFENHHRSPPRNAPPVRAVAIGRATAWNSSRSRRAPARSRGSS